MQGADPARDGVRKLRHRRRAVRAQNQMRRFHLHLKPQTACGPRVQVLQPGHGVRHRLHLRHGADLGQGEHQPVGQAAPAGMFGQGGDEQIQRAQSTGAGARLQTLEPDADKRRRSAIGGRPGHQLAGPQRRGVFLLVVALAVAVLEVQTQVFDRFGLQLAPD